MRRTASPVALAEIEAARVRCLYRLPWPWRSLDPEVGDELAGLWSRYGDAIAELGFLDLDGHGGRRPLRGHRGPTGNTPAFWAAAAWFTDDEQLASEMAAACRAEHDRQQSRRAAGRALTTYNRPIGADQ